MENVIHRLTLDLAGPDTIPRVEVQQDNARSLSVSLTQGGRPYWIAEGVTAVFSARKPDGNPLFNGCTIEKNRVRYDFTDQTTNVAGIVECEILLYSGDERILASPRFELAIDELIHKDGDVPESSAEISALTQMVAAGTAMLEDLAAALGGLGDVSAILEQARAAAEAASGSEAAARGHTKTAADAAADALTLAGRANEHANRAGSMALGASEEAGRAASSAQKAAAAQVAAETAVNDAQIQAQTAGDYAQAAEESAKRAEAAAGNAGSGGAGDINDAIDGHDTNLAAHPYFHERCNDLEEALKDKLGTGELGAAIDTALAEAKKSGAFDGADGADGRGIKSIARTSGNGAAGTVDTYTITYTDNTTGTFQVRNGPNGTAGKAATLEITGVTALVPGAAPIITEASDSTPQARKYALAVPQGAPGYTPQREIDYWTPTDQEAIVQQVIAALGTPVFGRVDGENNIILTGELADGTYTLKYEDGEGNVTEIGTLSTGVEELITENIPITWEVGLKLGKNDNNHTTVSVVEGTANGNAYAASQHIEYNPEASYTIAMSATGYRKISVCCYDEAGDNIGYLDSIIGENGANTGPASIQFTPVSGTKTFRFRLWFGYNGAPISNWISVISLSKTYVG